jgi:hypothetical protein
VRANCRVATDALLSRVITTLDFTVYCKLSQSKPEHPDAGHDAQVLRGTWERGERLGGVQGAPATESPLQSGR